VFAFEELAFYSKEMKILGVYPAHPFSRDLRGSGRTGGVGGETHVSAAVRSIRAAVSTASYACAFGDGRSRS